MSTEGPQQPMLVAGLTQSKKLIKVGMASSAFIAKDADAKIINLVAELCRTHGVPYNEAKTKKRTRHNVRNRRGLRRLRNS